MRRMNEETIAHLQSRSEAPVVADLPTMPAEKSSLTQLIGNRNDQHAITPTEGIEAFHRILAKSNTPQVIVSTRALPAVLNEAKTQTIQNIASELEALSVPQTIHARPNIKNPYIPPSNELETTVAEILQRVLGIDQVGIHDNFFELGGTSLTGIQFVSELKKALNVDIPTVSIFEAPTVSALAKYLNPDQSKADVVERSQNRADKKKQALQKQRVQQRRNRR
jgi:acyl carrier protein